MIHLYYQPMLLSDDLFKYLKFELTHTVQLTVLGAKNMKRRCVLQSKIY
jgi:hypothetical protein